MAASFPHHSDPSSHHKHPFYVVFILKGLLLDKKASPNLTNIAISSKPSYETIVTTAPFNYALFDDALECVVSFPTKINLTLRFGGTDDSDIYNWFEEHLAMTNGASKSSVISRLDNVTSLHAFSCYFDYSWKTIEVLPDCRFGASPCSGPVTGHCEGESQTLKLPLTALFTQQTSVFGFVCSTKQKGLAPNLT